MTVTPGKTVRGNVRLFWSGGITHGASGGGNSSGVKAQVSATVSWSKLRSPSHSPLLGCIGTHHPHFLDVLAIGQAGLVTMYDISDSRASTFPGNGTVPEEGDKGAT
jgi:hypothetical protein